MKNNNDALNLAIIGLSGRGTILLDSILDMDDVRVTIICDLYEDRMELVSNRIYEKCGYRPLCMRDYKEVVHSSNVDCVITPSSWFSHIEIALASMKAGKPVGIEVGGAYSIQECWDLVKTSEETGIDCMMLENCCYGQEEMTILNMIKKGIFGEIIHCQGGYQHDLRHEIAMGIENRHYRFRNYQHRNGELYPTHEIGPIAKYLNINRGNRFLTLTSMASKSRGLHEWIVEHKGSDHEHAGIEFAQGDIVTTMIKCAHGETVLLIHDTTLPRIYSRGGRVQGTKGIWMEDKKAIYIEGMSPPEIWWAPDESWEPFSIYLEKFEHPLWTRFRKEGVKGGHGGIDYLVLRAFIESVKSNTRTPIDVYDTAAWMAITCLSEESIAMGSMPVSFPDFTKGKWIDREDTMPSMYSLDKIID